MRHDVHINEKHMIEEHSSRPELASVQYLRAIAALVVVFFHSNGLAEQYLGNRWSSFGAVGVDLFFVISGFIMWITTASTELSPAHFMRNRLIRIVPLYWAVTLVVFVSAYTVHGGDHYQPSTNELVQSLLFVPFVSERTHLIQPILIAGWTLNFEMFFYAIFAVSLLLSRGWRMVMVTVALGTLVVLGVTIDPLKNAIFLTFTSPLLIEFLLGCLVGVLYKRSILPARPIGVMLLTLAAILMLHDQRIKADEIGLNRLVHWGFPAFLFVIGAVSVEPIKRPSQFLMVLGAASYSIYLTHPIVLAVAKDIVVGGWFGQIPANAYVFVPVACLIGVTAGVITYNVLERPLTTYLRSAKAFRSKRETRLARKAEANIAIK